jgi:hypothetical protein
VTPGCRLGRAEPCSTRRHPPAVVPPVGRARPTFATASLRPDVLRPGIVGAPPVAAGRWSRHDGLPLRSHTYTLSVADVGTPVKAGGLHPRDTGQSNTTRRRTLDSREAAASAVDLLCPGLPDGPAWIEAKVAQTSGQGSLSGRYHSRCRHNRHPCSTTVFGRVWWSGEGGLKHEAVAE